MDGIAGHDALDFISEIYDRISPAVVGVLTLQEGVLPDGNDALQAGSGSGLILRADGYIITNYHVIAAAQEISISLADGRTAEAQLVDAEQGSDLALLKIDLDGLPVAKLGGQQPVAGWRRRVPDRQSGRRTVCAFDDDGLDFGN